MQTRFASSSSKPDHSLVVVRFATFIIVSNLRMGSRYLEKIAMRIFSWQTDRFVQIRAATGLFVIQWIRG